ncbi:MAG TPA: hypothetical protein PLV92_28820, partial [Pirellulaceae bacterium]|nr:hypothetical protein [Pirellulaceae bacterium]
MTQPDDLGPARSAEPPAESLHADTRAIRGGRGANGSSLAPVLWATSAFVTPDSATAQRMASTIGASEFYGRYGNPTVCAFESAMAH